MSAVLEIVLAIAELIAAVVASVLVIYLVFAGADAWIAKLRGRPPAFEWWGGTSWRDRSSLGHQGLKGFGMTLALAVALFGVIAVIGMLFALAQCLSGSCPDMSELP